jgi:nucleoside 2-deoxyribosyltransferase
MRMRDLMGKVVYLAGPYTHPNNNHNTRRAVEYADYLVESGIVPLVPHMSHLWDSISPKNYPPDFWYNYDLRLLELCAAVVVMPGSEDSTGVKLERAFAKSKGIPVIEWDEQEW